MTTLVLILLLAAFCIGHAMGEENNGSPSATGLVALFLCTLGMGIYLLGDTIATEQREVKEHLIKLDSAKHPSELLSADMGVNRAD
jgi:hypothetical protein